MEAEQFILALINTSSFILVGMCFAFKVLNEQSAKAYRIRMMNPVFNKILREGHLALYFSLGFYFLIIIMGYFAILIKKVEFTIVLLFPLFVIAVILSVVVLAALYKVSDLDKFESKPIVDFGDK